MDVQNPQIKKASFLAPIWFIPIVALIIGLWLAIQSWQEKGPLVEIVLDTANGIETGQTEVRLKDVPVGKVTKLMLSDDLGQVRVFARLDRQVASYLSVNSRFWLVSPRISAQGVSNLGTLISGVYIVMDPGEPGPYHTNFTGLAEPPAIQSDDLGTAYVLQADELGSIDIGAPVYYRQIAVGEVTNYKLSFAGQGVEIHIFVKAPYDQLVLMQSRFWNVSGVSFDVGAGGIKAQIASLTSLISGGVAFANIVGFEDAKEAPAEHSFFLYSDRESVLEERFTRKYYFLLKFSHSARGLAVGAPVEFRGVKVGEVESIDLQSVEKGPDSLHVYVSIEPQRLDSSFDMSRAEFDKQVALLVGDGLQATIKTGSLLTGSRYIDLGFDGPEDGRRIVRHDSYTEIPAADVSPDQLDQTLATVANQIGQIPFDEIGRNLNGSLASLRSVLQTLEERNTAATLDNTLKNVAEASTHFEGTLSEAKIALTQLTDTLAVVDAGLAPDSETQYLLQATLRAIQEAASAFGQLTEKLNRKPDALIFGND